MITCYRYSIYTCIACVLPLGCLLRLFNRRALLLLLLMPLTLLDTRLLCSQKQTYNDAYQDIARMSSCTQQTYCTPSYNRTGNYYLK
jgi:hypothetical protein